MASGSDQEKTEKATPKKREEARRKGEVPKSKEVSSTVVFLAILGVLFFFGPYLLKQIVGMMQGFLSQTTSVSVTLSNLNLLTMQAAYQMVMILAPILAMAFIAGILGNVLQFGFLWTGETLVMDFNKINPVKGFGRIFSKRTLMEMLKSCAKIFIVGYLAYSVVEKEFSENLLTLADMDVWAILIYIFRISFKILLHVLWFLIVLSLLDYAFQRWQYEEQLKMTKQEVKDEFKQREGDPHIKARVRAIQREMAKKRMLSEVPHADVVITNPTHLAVAMKYDAAKGPAPCVVAKGADFLAQKIRDIAEEHHVPLVEDKPLAQALFKGVKVGGLIPEELYRAVAEILAYVYGLKRRPVSHEGKR